MDSEGAEIFELGGVGSRLVDLAGDILLGASSNEYAFFSR